MARHTDWQADRAAADFDRLPEKGALVPHEHLEEALGRYCGLMLFVKEMDDLYYTQISAAYLATSSDLYRKEIGDLLSYARSQVRKPTDDELEACACRKPICADQQPSRRHLQSRPLRVQARSSDRLEARRSASRLSPAARRSVELSIRSVRTSTASSSGSAISSLWTSTPASLLPST